MTREKAIKILDDVRSTFSVDEWMEEDAAALTMAIDALKQEPKTDNWSIKDVADTLVKHGLIVEQEQKTGHWIEHYNPEAEICMQHMSECSVCGKMICGRYNIYKNFCPNCGEKMEEQKTT